jgi:XTP/dITP diphosphohydrolase
MPPFEMLLVASHNKGKLRELEALLAPLGISIASAAQHHLPEPEETGDSFEANAALKAEHGCAYTGLAALADDSGLCVPALGGQPGIFSARWGGEAKDFGLAMQRVQDELSAKGITPEGAPAFFVCVLALARPNAPTQHFRGEIHGTLTFPPRGTLGFGYDPIFIPNHPDCPAGRTFAEIDPALKERISHRAEAFNAFIAFLNAPNSK